MKIGLSSSFIEPNINRGIVDGIGHYTNQLMEQLPLYDISVKGYAFPKTFHQVTFTHSEALPHSFPVQFLLANIPGYKLCNVVKDIDLFHSTDYRVIPLSCPVVATIWDAIVFAHPEWFSNGIKNRLVRLILKQSTKYADKVIAVSEHAAGDLQRYYGIEGQRIKIIPWCINDAWLNRQSSSEIDVTRKKYNIDGEYILTVGTIQPRKNVARIIDAFVALPDPIKKDLKLVIVGKYGWKSEDVIQKIKTFAQSGQVIWLSSVNSDQALRGLYQGAKLFMFPSLYEGFGMPVLEAFASQVPLITSNTTSIPEVCGDAAVQVDPLSVTDLKNAMLSLLTDEKARKELVAAGLKRLPCFREEVMMRKMVTLYKSLV